MALLFGTPFSKETLNSRGMSKNPGILYAPGPLVIMVPLVLSSPSQTTCSSRVNMSCPWVKPPAGVGGGGEVGGGGVKRGVRRGRTHSKHSRQWDYRIQCTAGRSQSTACGWLSRAQYSKM